MAGRFASLLTALVLSAAGTLHACAQLTTSNEVTAGASALPILARPIVLLGEVHDNAAQHALRLQAFKTLLAAGARPALLMEQFDRERQADIDQVRAQPGPADADRLIAAAGAHATRWNWSFYRPFIELALSHNLPIVAVNVSRADAQDIIAHGLAVSGFAARVPPDIEAAHTEAIERGHCGMVGTAQARRMALAQIARDQFMARAVEMHATRGVLLLAGNGHVRTDIGVPRWLAPATRERTLAIGLLEEGDDATGAYDHAIVTVRQPRQDPCNSLRADPSMRT